MDKKGRGQKKTGDKLGASSFVHLGIGVTF